MAFKLFLNIIDHTIKYCAVPYGDITAVVRSQDGAAQYLIGISINNQLFVTKS